MPSGSDYSPFAVRVDPGKRRKERSSKNALALRNPSLTGQSSTSSTTSGTRQANMFFSFDFHLHHECYYVFSTESEESSDDEMKSFIPKTDEKQDVNPASAEHLLTFSSLLPSPKQVYGTDIHLPSRHDTNLYRKYAAMAVSSCIQPESSHSQISSYKRLMLAQQSAFTVDNTLQVTTPFVGKPSLDVYLNYCFKGRKSRVSPTPSDLNLYRRYTSG